MYIAIRSIISVDGKVIHINEDFINGIAVMKSPSVEMANRVLRIQTPAGKLLVDCRREIPVFNFSGLFGNLEQLNTLGRKDKQKVIPAEFK